MERGIVNTSLVLSDDYIWHTPHVVQRSRQEELRWHELLRLLVQDLTLGLSQDEWKSELLREGNIGLARELATRLGVESSLVAEINDQESEWQQIVEMARTEAVKYMHEYSDELGENEIEEYEELLDGASECISNAAYGDALSILESALKLLQGAVERRRESAAAAFASAEAEVSKVRAMFAAIKVSRFPGGTEEHTRARELLLRADDRLYKKDYANALQMAEWVEALCKGQSIPAELVEKLIGTPLVVTPTDSEEPPPETQEEELRFAPEEELEFEREWSYEDDEFLIDNYDMLSIGQLKLRFNASEDEIERRIHYLGLVHNRETGKRRRWRNPYVAGRPLRAKQVFVGREDVFNFIESNLGPAEMSEDRNLIVLLGHRRTGKTSILLQLKKNRREILGTRIPIFVDMEGLIPFPGGLRNFFWKLASCVQRELEDLEGIALPVPVEDEFTDPAWNFQQYLHMAERAAEGKGLILMMDEFHAIEPRRLQLDRDLYRMLRSVIQHDPQVDFILSGTMEMERLMRTYQAALFGSAISRKIEFLDEKEAKKLVVTPVQDYVSYSQEAVDKIVRITASHPYFVQLICWTLMEYLIDRGKTRVSVYDVERILPLALERGVHFEEIWATDTSELERYVMAVVGELAHKSDNWCSIFEIQKRLEKENQMPKNADELDEAIVNLTNRRIFQRSSTGDSVIFQVDVLGQWVYANKPFEVVRRDIRAEAVARNRRVAHERKGPDQEYERRFRRGTQD
jgi:predicted RecB family endonuclease